MVLTRYRTGIGNPPSTLTAPSTQHLGFLCLFVQSICVTYTSYTKFSILGNYTPNHTHDFCVTAKQRSINHDDNGVVYSSQLYHLQQRIFRLSLAQTTHRVYKGKWFSTNTWSYAASHWFLSLLWGFLHQVCAVVRSFVNARFLWEYRVRLVRSISRWGMLRTMRSIQV